MQSQIDDQKEFKGVKNVIPMDNRTEQQIEQHDVKVEKSGIISKEQAEIIVLENADMEAKDISGLKTKIENYYVDILPMPKGRGFLDTNDTCLLK
ncbi:hypothetical protein SAMN05216340_12438 [Megamonas sp. Calf98-2]|uniref:hypothetical protein n=1 Tax=Megamonas sp. Calf98-2 TaxID=1855330 RepID=UPI0008D4F441|nr:hypothetical protein [Megamonas sp. Calf98-2]SEN49384.1 hypothetical protein SAMN05216340_12438 [Megamonas sp. Calf98-2]